MSPAALLLALVAVAPAPAAPARQPQLQPGAGQRLEIVVRFPPWEFTGTFTLEGAGLANRGVARDRGSLAGQEGPVERTLLGERGTIRLALRGQVLAASFPALLGRWQVVGATGAYLGLAGGGSFTATDLGSGKGSPLELQTLIGLVTPPRRTRAWSDPAGPKAAGLRPVGPAPER